MVIMPAYRQIRGSLFGLILAALLSTIACSRPIGDISDQTTPPVQQRQTPFQSDVPNSARPVVTSEDASGNLPFQTSESLPAGTLVTVQLKRSVYARNSISPTSFEAVVVQPVMSEGNTLIPAGATVAGRIEAARSSYIKPHRGYVRLALESVHVGDSDLPVQTASLFAREAPLSDQAAFPIQLEKGRRLTFRLAEPIYAANPRVPSTH